MAAYLKSNVFSDVYINGNCIVKGTITTLGSGTQWTTTGSAIYYNTGNIGIGTATPGQLLSLNNGNILLAGTWTAGTTYSLIGYNTDKRLEFNYSNGTVIYDNNAFLVRTGGSSGSIGNLGLYQNATGYVGIGTTNPGSLLTVSGGVGIGSGYQTSLAPTNGLIVQGGVGIGTTNPGVNALQVTGNVVTQGFTSNATNTVFNFDTLTVPFVNATQVGVGTTAPDNTIDAVGSIVAAPVTFLGASNYGLFFRRGFSTANFYNCSVMAYDHNGDNNPDGISINGYDGVSICTGSNTRQDRVRVSAAGLVGIGSTTPAYLLDVASDVNCSGSFRVNSILQPKVYHYNTFTGVTSFDAGNFDLTNFNNVEIRVIPGFFTTNFGALQIQALDTAGTVYSAGEPGYVVWQGNRSTAFQYGGSATVFGNTELATNGVGPYICVVRITGINGYTGSQRFHVQWTSTGCWAGTGAATSTGQCYFAATNIQLNRIRFNLVTAGTMTGKYSIVHYV